MVNYRGVNEHAESMKNESHQNSQKVRRKIFIETFVVFLIVVSPFVFKLHEYFSSNPEATINLFGYIIDRNGFANLSIYAWFMLGKFVPLFLLTTWFFTCKHWWYHAILIPIMMYAFQIFEVIFSDDKYVDTENLLWLLPVCMLVIPFVYLIRIRLYDRYVHGIDLEAMEVELNALKAKRSKIEVKKRNDLEPQSPDTIDYLSLSEWLNKNLSTDNLGFLFRKFQNNLKGWMNLKF